MQQKLSIRGLAGNSILYVTKAGKAYNPSASTAQNNKRSWQYVQAQIGKGNNTYAGLQAAVQKAHNHKPVVGWFVSIGKLGVK